MSFDFLDFEIPLLQVLINLGGEAKTKDVYPEVERILGLIPAKILKNMRNTKKVPLNGGIKPRGPGNT